MKKIFAVMLIGCLLITVTASAGTSVVASTPLAKAQMIQIIGAEMDASCWWSVAGMGVTMLGAVAITGGLGAILWGAALLTSTGSLVSSCG